MSDSANGLLARMERHQVAIYVGAILAGVLVGLLATAAGPGLEVAINPVLGALLYVTFLQVPARELVRSLRARPFLGAALVVNFVVVPVVVAAMFGFLPADQVVLQGELDISTFDPAQRRAEEAERARPRLLIIDLSELEFVDSTGVRLILHADERARSRRTSGSSLAASDCFRCRRESPCSSAGRVEGDAVPVTRQGRHGDELAMTVVRDGDAEVVLTGTLGPASARFVHDSLVALLRDVDCVLVDIADLAISRTSVLQVFPDAVDAVGGWPAAHLALVYRGRAMRQALSASRVATRVAVSDEPELARVRCGEQPREVRTRWELPADPTTPRRTRELLELRLASWSWPTEGRADVEAVLNELVTNAVLHAGTPVRVGLLLDEDGLRVEVRDLDPALPPSDPTAGPGLGLRLVQALAAQWGADRHADGKTVWARLA